MVHDRLGPKCDEEEEFHEEYSKGVDKRFVEEYQWCPSGVFNKTQKQRVQWMRCQVINRSQQLGRDDQDDAKGKKVWRPLVKS